MNQLENGSRRSTSAGRSRGRASEKGNGHSSSRNTSKHSSSGNYSRTQSSGRTGKSGRNTSKNSMRSNYRKHRKEPDYRKTALIGAALLVLIACGAFALRAKNAVSSQVETTTAAPEESQIQKEVKVDGIAITGMSKEQAKDAIVSQYPWSMTVVSAEETYEVKNLLESRIDALLDQIYSEEPKESYTLDTTGMEEEAAAEAAACAAKWDKKAKNGSIDSFDKEKNQFVFAGEENGYAIDQEALAADIKEALEKKEFDAQIKAAGSEVIPEITAGSAKEKYKTISTFTTETTSNKNRNTNIRLSAEAINGTVVKPGQVFSFNDTVGRRTEEKGYKGAAAYNNGEVVQEIGGGVCQVSTTLYNAVYRAGLEISFRRSHTFEPNYIRPGQDATVSYEQPDFKFTNNSSTAIGIKASYADQKVTISIYGIPILEDGVKWDLESKKVEDVDPPAPTYEEDQTLQPGVEVMKSAGTKGSRWETYKVVYQDGKEVSRELDHKTTYKGHAPVIKRNTSGVVLAPEETTLSSETPVPTIDGMPDGYIPEDSSLAGTGDGTTAEQGPGIFVPATTPAMAPSTGPSATSPAVTETQPQGPGVDNPVIAPLKTD